MTTRCPTHAVTGMPIAPLSGGGPVSMGRGLRDALTIMALISPCVACGTMPYRPPVRMKQLAQSALIQRRMNGWEQYDCVRKHLVGVPGAVSLPSRDESRRR